MNAPYISVVIPEYNETSQSIRKCLKSLSSQTMFNKCQVIVVSYTPHTLKILDLTDDEYDNVRLVNTAVKGIGYARNYGVKISSGKYIVNMDIDASFMKPDAIEKLIRPLELGVTKMTHCNAFLDPFEKREFAYADLVYALRNHLASDIMVPHIIEQGLCFRKSDYDITPGFRNVPISEGGVLGFEFAMAFGIASIMKVEDVSVITSARRINNLSKQTIFDVFNYDNAYR